MNIDVFWQANRKFIIGLFGGMIAFFIALSIVAGPATDRFAAAERSVNKTKRSNSSTSQYSVSQVRELEQTLAQLDADVDALTTAALPPFRKRFQIPMGVAAASHYIALTGELRDELIGWALRHNVHVDESLGLPSVSPSQPLAIEQHLRALDVIDRVVHLAIDNGASEIDKIRISQQRRVRSGRRSSPLLITPLSLEITFQRVSVTPFLRTIMLEQQKGNSLGVVSLEVLPPNQKKGEQRIVIEFEIGVFPQATQELE
ncbi:MAG TPA: hypothetical protein EYN86_01065 [Planctomycetes bacterium]|jgi:hypothetical protein|nr:hypothetical protein [Planctomycetota bacterium]